MTVVVGFVAADGALMASDSEATESGHTRYDVEKIWPCRGLLMGYTGSSSVKDRLAPVIEAHIGNEFGDSLEVDRHRAADLIQAASLPVLRHVYGHFVGATPDEHMGKLAGALLVIGRDSNGYWLLELDHNNTATFYTGNSFHTVGSGSSAAYVAMALMSRYDVTTRDAASLKLVAHRTVQNCIDSLGGQLGVGGYVQMWCSESNEAFGKVDSDGMEIIVNGVDQWTTIERESLNEVGEARDESEEKSGETELPRDLGEGAQPA